MPTFPSLTKRPTYPLEEEREDATIRSSFEAGYEHTRPRFTRNRKMWKVKYKNMGATDKATLDSFVTTVREGSDAFTWTNPQDNVAYTVRFAQIPRYVCNLKMSDKNVTYFDVEFILRQV